MSVADALKQVQKWWANLRPRSTSRTVSFDDLGVSHCEHVGDEEFHRQIPWNDIDAVFAFKRDCFAVDQICVALIDNTGVVQIAFSEDDAGYQMLIDELPNRLSGCLPPQDWFERVAFPAFETNGTELYRRIA